jgi:hypothetical protein
LCTIHRYGGPIAYSIIPLIVHSKKGRIPGIENRSVQEREWLTRKRTKKEF